MRLLTFRDVASVTQARTDSPIQFHEDVEVMLGSRLYRVYSRLGRVTPITQSWEADRRNQLRNTFQIRRGNTQPISGTTEGANQLQQILFEDFGPLHRRRTPIDTPHLNMATAESATPHIQPSPYRDPPPTYTAATFLSRRREPQTLDQAIYAHFDSITLGTQRGAQAHPPSENEAPPNYFDIFPIQSSEEPPPYPGDH